MILCCSRINAVSNAQVRGDSYESGCLGRTGKGTLSCSCALAEKDLAAGKKKSLYIGLVMIR